MGTITVFSPTGEPLNFPDTMTEDQITEVMRQQFPPTQTAAKPVPEGYSLVEAFDDGGRILSFDETGRESYVSEGGSTGDPNVIAMMRRNKGNVGEGEGAVIANKVARDLVAQAAGERNLRALSAFKGVPAFRGYVEKIAGFGAGASGDPVPDPSSGANMATKPSGEVYSMTPSPVRATEGLIRQAIQGREMEAPLATDLSRLGTGIGTAAVTLPLGAATTFAGRVAQGVGIGSPLAALEGFFAGYGEGGMEEAKAQAKTGAAAGALFGAAAPVVGLGASTVANRYLSEPVKNIMEQLGFKGDAAKVAQDFLSLDSAEAVANAQRMGPYGSIASTGGATEALLDQVANSPEGRKIVVENLNETASVAAKDLVDTIDTQIGKPFGDLVDQKQKIMADTAAGRRELYGQAYDFEIDPNTDGGAQVVSLFNRVSSKDLKGAQDLLKEANEPSAYFSPTKIEADDLNSLSAARRSEMNITSNADGTYTVQDTPTVASLDYLSRQLYGESEALARAGNTTASRSKRDLSMQIRTALDDISPEYAAARASGKDAIDQRIAADIGDQILNPKMTRAEVERSMQGMDEVGKKQLRQALRNKIEETAANAKVSPTSTTDADLVEALAVLKTLGSRAVADKMRMALGDEAAGVLAKQINDTSAALMQRALVASNSKTAIRGLVNERMKQLLGENLGETVARQGLLPTMTGAVAEGLVSGPSQRTRMDAVARELAPVLTQRLTPQQLQQSAAQMEALTPAIGRARRGSQAAGNLAQRTMMGAGQSQNIESEDSRVRQLMQQFGIMNQR